MVQKEVRKKTKIYGTVAVLSAIILVSLIYAFGAPNNISAKPNALCVGNESFLFPARTQKLHK
jgi:hypothetical protein